jgi:nicotinate-nucleotide adenylyltransferase
LPAIGILGGTFNPPHIGHLICAQEAAAALGLERVLLMPVAVPPHKQAAGDPGAEHRVELCRLVAEEDERLEASRLEVDRGGPSYTVDTLAELREARPADELTFIAGADMASSLPAWREPERVLALARFAVAERAGTGRQEIARRLAGLAGAEGIAFFEMPRVDIASSDIRRRVAEGRPIRYLVTDAVAQYIGDHGLYRTAVAAR